MSSNLKVALELKAIDNASKVVRAAMQTTLKSSQDASKGVAKHNNEQNKSAQSGIKASQTLTREFQRNAQAREALGIRSERAIQREITQTEAAYNRLSRSGQVSATEQARAFTTMKKRVGELRQEMGQLTKMQRAGNVMRGGAQIAAGIGAASMVLSEPVRKQMNYEQRLLHMTNVAYADEDAAGRIQKKGELETGIRHAVTYGGGSKDSAADALDKMLASGAVSIKSGLDLLPTIQKYATATNSETVDLANIAISLKRSFGVEDNDIEKALNMAIVAGQEGSFELADLAKFIPSHLAAAGNAGMSGLDDFSTLLALAQTSAITAGTNAEAGTNMANLLAKINSRDTATAASRIDYNGKGIDLPGSLAAAREQGLNSLDGFVAIVDKLVANDSRYQELQTQLQGASGSERETILNSMSSILEGSVVGRIVNDQGALRALVGYRANREYAQSVKDKSNEQRTLKPGEYAGDVNYEVLESSNAFQSERRQNAADFAEMDAVKPLSDILGEFSKKMAATAEEFPTLAAVVMGATTGIKALAAAAVAGAGVMMLTGGGKGSFLGKAAGAATSKAATTGAGSAANGVLKNAGKWAGRIAAPLMIYEGLNEFPIVPIQRNADRINELKQAGVTAPVVNNSDDYNALSWKEKSSYLALNSNKVGALDVWDEIKAFFTSTPQQPPVLPTVNIKLELDGRTIAEVVNDFNGQQAVRN
jgi:hypothetical protein